MDKKGQEQWKVVNWIIAIAILLLVFLVILPMLIDNSETPIRYLPKIDVDFDGDNPTSNYINDEFDPCACGHGTQDNNFDGVDYCIADTWDIDKCKKANWMISGEGDTEKFFPAKASENEQNRCYYSQMFCRELINCDDQFNKNYGTNPNGLVRCVDN